MRIIGHFRFKDKRILRTLTYWYMLSAVMISVSSIGYAYLLAQIIEDMVWRDYAVLGTPLLVLVFSLAAYVIGILKLARKNHSGLRYGRVGSYLAIAFYSIGFLAIGAWVVLLILSPIFLAGWGLPFLTILWTNHLINLYSK